MDYLLNNKSKNINQETGDSKYHPIDGFNLILCKTILYNMEWIK